MAKLFRSKYFIGAVCILLAAAVAFFVLPRFYQEQAATETVVKVRRNIPAGTVITASMVSEAEVGAYGLTDNVLRSVSDAVGKVAAENLYAGEYLIDSRLMTEEAYAASRDEKTLGLTGGQCLVTIEFPSSSAGIAGVLRGGNYVDVYEYTESENEDGETEYAVEKVLHSMYVYDVLNRGLESLNVLDERRAALPVEEEDTAFDYEPAYVVFRCAQSQIQTLIRLERCDSLHLALTKTEA